MKLNNNQQILQGVFTIFWKVLSRQGSVGIGLRWGIVQNSKNEILKMNNKSIYCIFVEGVC